VLGERPNLVTDPAEVDRAFTVSLKDLLADGSVPGGTVATRRCARPGRRRRRLLSDLLLSVPGDLIWGATARVLTELLCVVTGVAWPDAQRVVA
jgi:hypothetical protein